MGTTRFALSAATVVIVGSFAASNPAGAAVETVDLGTLSAISDAQALPIDPVGGPYTFAELSFDWTPTAGDPWSLEALWALAKSTTPGEADEDYYYLPNATSIGRPDSSPRTVAWAGYLREPLPIDAPAALIYRQRWSGTSAEWANVTLRLGDSPVISGFSGNTTGQPTWSRPNRYGEDGSEGDNVPYQATPFHVTADGVYTLASDDGSFDGFIYLYADAFDAAQPGTNFVGGADFIGDGSAGFDVGAEINAAVLEAGRQYYFVQSGFADADFGAYDVTAASLAGSVVVGIVPEPTSLGLAAMAGLLLTRRRRI